MKNKFILAIIVVLLTNLPVSAQTASVFSLSAEAALYIITGLVFVVALIVLLVAFSVYNMLKTMMETEARKRAEAEGREYVAEGSLFAQMMHSWTKSVPLEEEKSIELDHEYDGIRELDNHLPPWWLALFYGSVVFGVIYMIGYHIADWWPLQEEEYQIAQEEAAARLAANVAAGDVIDENSIEYNSDPAFLAQGKAVYEANCAACHRADGGGINGLGPNLADAYWLHGGKIGEIFKTVTYGVPANGMAAWEKSLTSEKRAQVSSYVYSLYGTNPPDAREPQGVEVLRDKGNETEVPSDSSEVATPTGQ